MKMTRPLTISGFFPHVLSSARARTRLVEALPSFLGAVAGHSGPTATASAIATGLVEDLGAVTASIYLADAQEQTLRLEASHGAEREHLDLIAIDSPPLAARAARTRAVQLVDQTQRVIARVSAPLALARAMNVSTAVAFPLLAGDRLVGVVAGELGGQLEPRDLEALEQLGPILGALLDRTRLEEELRTREGWVGLVAHEIRQPLTMILMHATSLVRMTPEAATIRSAKHVIAGVHRLNRLVGDLVDTTLNDVEEVPLKIRSTDLGLLAEGLAGPAEEGRSPRVRVDVRGELPEIDVDPDRIQQVLSNLVANAMKYGNATTPIVLSLERQGDDVVISVTNEGRDIPAQEQSRIFDRYYRAHKNAAIGWGIGLYVCRSLVEAHGGRISVTSEGGTTTFFVALPIDRPAPSSAARPR